MRKYLIPILFILLVLTPVSHAYTVGSPSAKLPPASSSYAPDAGAADQGVTDTGAVTLKNLVDEIGTSKIATIIFSHTGAGNTTTYTLTTSETITSNITLWTEPGAIIDGAGTLTINGPLNEGLHQRFGSSVTVAGLKESYVSWFGDNSSSDSIQAAVNSLSSTGGEIIFTTTQHTISISSGIGVRVDKSNVVFRSTCRTQFVHDGSDVNGLWFSVGASSDDDSFVQVHDILFDGLVFTGSAISTSTTQAAIYVKVHSTTYTPDTDGAYNITVKNCKITGFTMSFYAKGAYKVDIHHNEMGDNVYIPGAGAGGYCVLAETTYDLKIHHNDFISGTEDRHAIYVSVDQAKTGAVVQCKDVQITDNFIDWSNTVEATNGYRSAFAIRCLYGITISGNTIRGSMQYGIVFSFEDGHGSDYVITDNIITDVRVIAGATGGGIIFVADATYNGTHVVIKNSIITEGTSTEGFYGIQITDIDAIVGGNKITADGAASIGILIENASKVIILPNEIELSTTARSGIAFAGTCDNITIHLQDIKDPAISKIESIGSPTLSDIHWAFSLTATISSDGIGGITVTEYGYNFISSVVSEANGCTITFNDFVTKIGSYPHHIIPTSMAAAVRHRYLRSTTATTLVLGITDEDDNLKPLATNADDFLIVYPSH